MGSSPYRYVDNLLIDPPISYNWLLAATGSGQTFIFYLGTTYFFRNNNLLYVRISVNDNCYKDLDTLLSILLITI